MHDHDSRHDHDHDLDHDDHHDHGGHHHHGHGHSHAPASFGKAFAIGIALNMAFVIIEGGYGYFSNSMALLADAGHNLSDVFGLAIAWLAAHLGQRPPSERYTYGLRGTSILAALFNAVFLLIAVGAIGWEAILRLLNPEPVAGMTMIVVSAVGIVVNSVTAWLFASGRKGDINIKAAFLHMAADAAVSLGVVIAGVVILFTHWLWLDPAVSLAIVAVIVWGTWGLLRDSFDMAIDAVPSGIDNRKVCAFLEGLPGVESVHDLHIWPMSTTEIALTAHLVMPQGAPGDAFLHEAGEELKEHHGIGHVTLQIERDGSDCPLVSDHVV